MKVKIWVLKFLRVSTDLLLMHDQLKMYIKYMTTENVDLIHDELKKYINTLN